MARRVPLVESYPTVLDMRRVGMSTKEIARRLGKSQGQINWIIKHGASLPETGQSQAVIIPDFTPPHKLDTYLQHLIEPTPDAFEEFFNRYSDFHYKTGPLKGERSFLQAHSKRFVQAAWGKEAVVVTVPPRHAKSEIFSVWLPLWMICQNRDVQILLLSNSLDQALKFTRELCDHMEGNDRLIQDFTRFVPDSSSTWSPSTGRFVVAGRRRHSLSGDLTVMARGSGQRVYGFEADLIVADDLVDDENSATREQRNKLANWFHGIVESRLSEEGKTWFVGTRFHQDDLAGRLINLETPDDEYDMPDDDAPTWEHINFPAVLDWKAKEVLWPQVWTFDKLMKKRRRIGKPIFEQMYQQHPIPSDARLVQPEWIELCKDHDRVWGPTPKEGTRVVSIDPSPTRYWGIVVADVAADPKRFYAKLLEVQSRRMGLRECITELERLAQVYNLDQLVFEKNAAQRWFFEDLGFEEWRKKWRVRVQDHETGMNKLDSDWGFQSLGRDFEYGMIRLPSGSPGDRDAMAPLVNEALDYVTGGDSRDDVLMALWQIKAVHQRKPFRPSLVIPDEAGIANVPPRLKGGFAWMR